jgi:pimeloyl-ACP methyl ester carboxylesterase
MLLQDGRTLEYCLTGPVEAEDLLVFHLGTPEGAVDFPLTTKAAAARGIRTVTCSRPGYANSTRKPGWIEADIADDTAALADHLGAGSFLVAGWSGGGAPALACAALLPERVRACVVIAGSGPIDAFADDWPEWYPAGEREELEKHLTSTLEDLTPEYEQEAEKLALTTASFDGWGLPQVDMDALRHHPAAAEALAESVRRSVSTGFLGWFDEAEALAHPWGVDLSDIRVPVTVRHGTADENVVVEHGRWLAAHIPGARAQILDGEGHVSAVMPFEPVVSTLLETSS